MKEPKENKKKALKDIKQQKRYPKSKLLYIIILISATLILYGRMSTHNFTNWDDDFMVTNNTQITNLSGANIINILTPDKTKNEYQPLTVISYAIIYNFFELNPTPYKIINLLFHILNTLIVFLILLHIFGTQRWAFIGSLLFAINPLQVEAVVWISAHNYMLYSFFFLLSILFYIKYLKEGFQKKHLIYSILLFIPALMSKSSAVSLPIVLLCFDYFYNNSKIKRIIIEKIPYFLLALFFGILALIPKAVNEFNTTETYNIIDRFFLATYSFTYYIFKVIFPVFQKIVYAMPVKAGNWLPLSYYLSPLFIIAIFLLVRRVKFEKRTLIFGLLFLTANILLTLHLIPFYHVSIVADRYTYIGCIGIFIPLLLLIKYIIDKYPLKKGLIYFLLVVYGGTLSYISFNRINVWKDSETLWTNEIGINPRNTIAYNSRGNDRYGLKNFKGALEDFNKTIELDPKSAQTYNNRGNVKKELGDFNGALVDYTRAIELKPNSSELYNNRGNLKRIAKDFMGAIKDYNKAIEIQPDYAKAYNNLGNVQQLIEDYDNALENYQAALSIKPDYAEAYFNMGLTHQKQNDFEQALNSFNKALEIKPDYAEAYYNSGNSKCMLQKYEEGISLFNEAIRLKPDYSVAFYNRANAKIALGKLFEACLDWETAAKAGDNNAATMHQMNCK